MASRDAFLPTRSGLRLAARFYGADERAPAAAARRFVLLHGWMDNLESFSLLCPALLSQLPPHSCLLALDFAGHGLSDHLAGGFYTLPTLAALVAEALEVLDWQRYTLLAHSMGGGAAMLLGGALPERCRALVLLDSAGPQCRPPSEAPEALHQCLAAKAALAARPGGSTYACLEDAVRARLMTVAGYPGAQTLSAEGARALVARMLTEREPGAWRWTWDQCIKAPSLFGLSEEAVLAFCARLGAGGVPALLLRATRGWPYSQAAIEARAAALGADIQPVEGGHHLHLDPETAPLVAQAVMQWLTQRGLLQD